MKVLFTGDLHFGHENAIQFDGRPFKTVEEMDAEIIRRWNNKVNKGDLIEDAKSGKIDHICIYSLWDFWHSPKKLLDTINELKALPKPVGIRFIHLSSPCVFDKCSLNEKECNVIMQESEQVEKMTLDFKAVGLEIS